LKAPGSHASKEKCDEPLSNFGFNFTLRRYIKGDGLALTGDLGGTSIMVGRCKLTPIPTPA
jgi:hypothetical protein